MPYIFNDNVKIHYEIEGNGPPLLLNHCLMGSLEDWYEYGYVDALKGSFRLILIDGRGHGKSGKPHDPEQYSLYLHALDVVKVLDALSTDKCHYWGFSIGGMISFGLIRWFPERFSSFIIHGMHPYESDPDLMKNMIKTMDEWIPQEFASEVTMRRYLGSDRAALLSYVEKKREDQTETLKNITVPCLMMAGELDNSYERIKTASKLSEQIEFVTLPGVGHGDSFFKSELTLPYIKRFIDAIDSGQ